MDAVALAVESASAIVGQRIGNLQAGSYVTDGVVAYSYVCNLANRTGTGSSRILWRQHDSKAHLRKTAPGVFHYVAFDQNPLRILQFEQILDDERISVGSSHESQLALHPGQRLEHVI